MTLKEPIVEGAYYEREDGQVFGPAAPVADWPGYWLLCGVEFWCDGRESASDDFPRLTRRVYLVPTDPAEVVAELRVKAAVADARHNESGDSRALGEYVGLFEAADLVAEKLGVK